ncbi:MAG: CotH kinase family protein [Prevotella sp.]|nr:CotH kinase family protein [Prevotella sp.]MBO6255266.1 CotH kinase family protein [Bacteroidaceae bacterium]
MKYRFLFLLVLALISIKDVNAITDEEKQQLIETGLPLVVVETVDHEEPTYEIAVAPPGCLGQSIKNATKVPGRLTIIKGEEAAYDSGDYEKGVSGITIKVRGNWSANLQNHPYKIKLQKKDDLLCRGDKRYKDKNWVLLRVPNLNTLIGFKINEMLGLQWTPCYQYVNVVLNGDYRGVYMLTESVERNADCRLNVDKNTGYVAELDAYWWNEDLSVESSFVGNANYTFKYPDSEDITEEQLSYFQESVHKMEASLVDGTYTDYIDVESFANWMLAHDILGDVDPAGSNIFITKYDNSSDTKFLMGPLWDYDCIMESEEWAYVHYMSYYFPRLFESKNGTFRKTYTKRWKEIKDTLFDSLFKYFVQFSQSAEGKALKAAIPYHNNRWEKYQLKSVTAYLKSAQSYFKTRKSWLEENIALVSPRVTVTVTEGGNVLYNETSLSSGTHLLTPGGNTELVFEITPENGYYLESVEIDGEDVTSQVADGKLTIAVSEDDIIIEVHFSLIPTEATIVIGDDGQITYCSDHDLDFSKVPDIKAFIASGFNVTSATVTMKRVTDVPAGTGLIIKGEAGTYKVPYTESSMYYANLLKGDLATNTATLQLPKGFDPETLSYLFTEEYKKGDVNGDGEINEVDAQIILDYSVAKEKPW